MIKGIAHLAYQVSDMTKSLAFYDKAFGFKPLFELHDHQDQPWIVYLQVNATQFIELFYAHQPLEQRPHHTSFQHLCLEVTDIANEAKRLQSLGIPLLHPLQRGLDHNDQCWVLDPDGNPIELMEYGPQSLQLNTKPTR